MGVLLYVMCFFSLPAFKIFFLFFNILLWWYWVWSLWVYLELIEFLGCVKFFFYQIWEILEFPGGPVFRTLWFHCWGPGLILGQGTKILWAVQAVWPKKRKKKKEKIRNLKSFQQFFWISFSVLLMLSSLFSTPIMHILMHLFISHISLRLCSSSVFLSVLQIA